MTEFHFVALHHLAGAIQGGRRMVGDFEENYAHYNELFAKIDEAETIDDKKSLRAAFRVTWQDGNPVSLNGYSG